MKQGLLLELVLHYNSKDSIRISSSPSSTFSLACRATGRGSAEGSTVLSAASIRCFCADPSPLRASTPPQFLIFVQLPFSLQGFEVALEFLVAIDELLIDNHQFLVLGL